MSSSPVAIPINARKTTSMPTERASPGKVATSPKKTRKIGTSRHPKHREKDADQAAGARDPRKGRAQPKKDEKEGDEPRPAECVGEAPRHEHRRQSGDRDAEQRQPELRVARAGGALDCREAGSPRAPEQSEDGVGRGKTASPPQSCKYLSTRFCS